MSANSALDAESEGRRIGGNKAIQEVDPEQVKRERALKKDVPSNGLEQMYGREEGKEEEDMECPNCKLVVPAAEVMVHTVACYRNSTKCRICDEVIQKDSKKAHLEKWRNTEVRPLNLTTSGPAQSNPFEQRRGCGPVL